MTKYKIVMFDTALSDLEDIKAYYIREASLEVAISVLGNIRKRIDGLTNMPKIYPVCKQDARFRCLVIDKYLVFYDVDEETHVVEIHHIWHGMRNIKKLLEKEE